MRQKTICKPLKSGVSRPSVTYMLSAKNASEKFSRLGTFNPWMIQLSEKKCLNITNWRQSWLDNLLYSSSLIVNIPEVANSLTKFLCRGSKNHLPHFRPWWGKTAKVPSHFFMAANIFIWYILIYVAELSAIWQHCSNCCVLTALKEWTWIPGLPPAENLHPWDPGPTQV